MVMRWTVALPPGCCARRACRSPRRPRLAERFPPAAGDADRRSRPDGRARSRPTCRIARPRPTPGARPRRTPRADARADAGSAPSVAVPHLAGATPAQRPRARAPRCRSPRRRRAPPPPPCAAAIAAGAGLRRRRCAEPRLSARRRHDQPATPAGAKLAVAARAPGGAGRRCGALALARGGAGGSGGRYMRLAPPRCVARQRRRAAAEPRAVHPAAPAAARAGTAPSRCRSRSSRCG